MEVKKLKKQKRPPQKNPRLIVLHFKTLLTKGGVVDVSSIQVAFGVLHVTAKIVQALFKQMLLEVGVLLQ
jgi:hypothetical protein